MTLNKREKFVLHSVSASLTLEGLDNDYRVQSVMDFIINNRCRGLSNEEVTDMIQDIKEELLLSKTMWDEFDSNLGR